MSFSRKQLECRSLAELHANLVLLNESERYDFLKQLGKDKLNDLFAYKCFDDIIEHAVEILAVIPEKDWINSFELLDLQKQFCKLGLVACETFAKLIEKLPENKRYTVISSFGADFWKKQILYVHQFKSIVRFLPKENIDPLCDFLGPDYFRSRNFIYSEFDFKWLLAVIPEKNRRNFFVKQLGGEKLKNLWVDEKENKIDYKFRIKQIHSSQLSSDSKKDMVLCLALAYHSHRSSRGTYTSCWGRLFGHSKDVKLQKATELIEAIKQNKTIEVEGALNSGELGTIAKGYHSIR